MSESVLDLNYVDEPDTCKRFTSTQPDIYFNGCSFVQGMELQDRFNNCFTHLVAEHFNTTWSRSSKIGGGNDRILRVTSTDMMQMPKKPKLVILVWSGPNRVEYLNDLGIWRQVGHIRFAFDKNKLKIIHSEIYCHPDMTRDQYDGWKKYMKNCRNIKWNLLETLHNMIYMRHMLNNMGIPHLFYWMSKGQIDCALQSLNDNRKEGANVVWEQQYNMKEKDFAREIPELYDEGFYEMTKFRLKNKYGPLDHPLEEGHQAIADRIIKDIYDKKLDKLFN